MAILRMMGVAETIAETIDDYVSVAVRLAQDAPWRMAVKAKISANKHRIYFDRACILGLEQFLNHVVRRDIPNPPTVFGLSDGSTRSRSFAEAGREPY